MRLDIGLLLAAAPRHLPTERPDRHERPRARRVSRPPVPASLPSPRVARGRRRAGLVLIVDDSLHTRELYNEYLTFRGFGVITAPDGENKMSTYPLPPAALVIGGSGLPKVAFVLKSMIVPSGIFIPSPTGRGERTMR